VKSTKPCQILFSAVGAWNKRAKIHLGLATDSLDQRNNVAVLALSYACGEIDGDLCARCVRESSRQCDPGCRERLSDVLRHSLWREGAPKGAKWLPKAPSFFAESFNGYAGRLLSTASFLDWSVSWFSKLQRDVIDRGIFTSVADLKRKITRYIRLYQKTAKPFQWKYSDVRKRIPAW
jgi:hypothetical protein